MIIDGKKYVVLYLTGWQIRMVEDVLGVPNCRVWKVPVGGQPVLKYMGPHDPGSGAKRMYLTEWQREEIKHEADEDCTYVELGPSGPNSRYMGPFKLEPQIAASGEVTYRTVV